MSQLYPIFTDISGRRVVVVGGGRIAEEKIRNLLTCQADILLVSPDLTDQLAAWVSQGRLKVCRRAVEAGDIDGAWLVVVACGVESVNQQIYRQCLEKRIFCNVVDVIDLCIFQVPAVCRRGPLQLAISTAGKSPALAKRIRHELERNYDEAYEVFLEALGELRGFLKERHPDDRDRRSKILERLANSDAPELIRDNDMKGLARLVEDCKNS